MAKEVTFLIKIDDKGSFKQVTMNAEELGRVVRSVQDESESLKKNVLTWSQAAQAVDVLQNSIGELHAVMKDLAEAYDVQETAEVQLETIMRQRMGANEEQIQSIKDLASAQQELGVIGDEVQLSGAQQMATFLNQKQSLDVLIPAMNNLIAQQNGLNATNQDAVSIGNMMGKAMQGQTEVLQRVGITFTEAQKRMLTYGDESERAAVLAQVITDNVGQMNAELAKTDGGKTKQLTNTLGDYKEKLGQLVGGAMPFITITAQVTICIAATAKLVTSMAALSAAFSLSSIKAAVLVVHQRMVAVAQNLLAASGYTATAGTVALTVAVTALYAALTMGLSAVITGVISLFTSMGDEAEDTASEVDTLKESTDAFSNASSNAKAEIDMEVSALSDLINSHKNTSKKVDELNKKYGESFGYHRTASEWYDTLISKSKVYCQQIGYEAQARVLASQIAAKQLEKEAKEQERFQLGQQYWDGNGKTHYNWENANGGKDYYDQLGGDISRITQQIAGLQKQYDSAIKHMADAQKQLENSKKSVDVSSKDLSDLTTEELKRTVEKDQQQLDQLTGKNTAERQRLNREIKRLNAELKRRDNVNKQEQGTATTTKKTTTAKTSKQEDKPVANAVSLADAAKNVKYYEEQLNKTNKNDKEKIQNLTALIQKYKDLEAAIKAELDAANRPKTLDTLANIDREITYQRGLRQTAHKEQLSQIDAEIDRLNDLITAFERQSHVDVGVEQITTYRQLDREVQYYTELIKTASEEERKQIQKRLNELDALRKKWDETLAELKKPEDISRLNTIGELDEAISYYQTQQNKATDSELANIQKTLFALNQKRNALQGLSRIPEMQDEVAQLDGMSAKELKVELKMIGIEGIRGKIRELQKMLEDTKSPLTGEQREEVEKTLKSWQNYEKVLRKSDVTLEGTWGNIKGLGGGLSSMTDALQGNRGAWETVTAVVDAAIQIYQGVMGVISIVRALTAVTETATVATTVSQAASTAATTAKVAETPGEVASALTATAAIKVQAMAYRELAASAFMAAHAYIPFAGAGIAAGFIAMMEGLVASVAVTPFANGGIVYGPTLALMGEYSGASRNPEVIAPLDKLRSLIGDGGGGGTVKVVMKQRGRDLVGVGTTEKKINRKWRS